MKSAKEYRQIARESLSGNWGAAIGAVIVYGLMLGALCFTAVGSIVLGGALMCGLAYVFMMTIREKKVTFENLFEGFKKPGFSATIGLNVKMAIFILLWTLLFYIPGIIAVFKYSMAPYILMDHPEMTGGEAITASKNLMKGKKWKLFCVEFSFIGWCLLGALTFGIAFIWIEPYMQATVAAFYEDIKDEVGTTVAE